MKHLNKFENVLAAIFGYMFLALSVLVTFETIARKAFGFSVQGADELGGYALAVGSSLAFSVAIFGRSHIRIDLLHSHMPKFVQSLLNWLAAGMLALFGGLVLWTGYRTLSDTIAYKATAATPWQTPLIYPQSIWYGALVFFAFISIVWFLRATYLFFSGRHRDLDEEFHPKNAIEELKEEIEDVQRREA